MYARAWICHGFVIPFLSLQVQALLSKLLAKTSPLTSDASGRVPLSLLLVQPSSFHPRSDLLICSRLRPCSSLLMTPASSSFCVRVSVLIPSFTVLKPCLR